MLERKSPRVKKLARQEVDDFHHRIRKRSQMSPATIKRISEDRKAGRGEVNPYLMRSSGLKGEFQLRQPHPFVGMEEAVMGDGGLSGSCARGKLYAMSRVPPDVGTNGADGVARNAHDISGINPVNPPTLERLHKREMRGFGLRKHHHP